jgi:peptide-methionine (S)-S-oxide reductase
VGFRGTKASPANPKYEDVCTGKTGHVEVYEFEFEGGSSFYEDMVRSFFQFHDPTTKDKQGNDAG